MTKPIAYRPLAKPTPLSMQKWPKGVVPLVTTLTTTYMHGPFIRQCIEGILKQETTFPVQVLIHDDASTDETTEILREYEKKYPGLVKVCYQKSNTYRSPAREKLRSEFFSWIEGKYIALCEGDDFWISKAKLQEQATFLERNPDYAFTFHNAVVLYEEGGGWKAKHRYNDFDWCHIDFDRDTYDGHDFLSDLHPPTASVVYRRPSSMNRPRWSLSVPSGDIVMFSMALGNAKARFFNWDGSAYRKHRKGITAGHRGDYIHVGRIITYLGLFSYHKGNFAGIIAATIRKHLHEVRDADSFRDHPFSKKLFREIAPHVDALEAGHAFRELYQDLGVILGEEMPLSLKSVAVFVIHGPNQVNGPNVWLLRLLPELVRRGFRITVLAVMAEGKRCQIVQALEIGGVRVDVIKPLHTEDSVRQILGYLKQHPTQVFVPNLNVPAYFASSHVREGGIPTVGILHSDDDFHHDLEEEFLIGKQGKYLSGCVIVSKQQQTRLAKLDTSGSEMLLAPYGAPISEQSCHYSKTPFRCLYVGRLRDQQKRVTDMVAGMVPIMRQFPELEFHLCGEGEARARLEKMVADAGLSERIQIHGNLSQDSLRKLSLECQAFLLLSDYEGIPIALMEAMAYGLVPICNDIRSGIPELITDGVEGLIVRDRGPGLKRAVARLLQDQEGWKQMSEAARTKIDANYSSERNVEVWAELLNRMAEQNTGSSRPINIPDVIELPPKRLNPLGMAREDHRKPTAKAAFTAPAMSPNNADLYWQRQSILEAIHSTKPLFNGVFLDVGCGIMPYKTILTDQGSRIERYIGLDIETETYQADVDLRWDGHTIPMEDDSVDSAMATEVLEHCPEPLVVLKEIRRVLKPGGVFFFTVPYIWPLHDAPYDFFRYTPFALERLLEIAGFTDYNLKALGGWNASLAQMIGLWLKRAPMEPSKRNEMAQKLYPFYQQLISEDDRPSDVHRGDTMATGWSGTAYVPTAEEEEPCSVSDLKICLVRSHASNYSETFIEDHQNHLSRELEVLHGYPYPRFRDNGSSVLGAEAENLLRLNPESAEGREAYIDGIAQHLKGSGYEVVLAESGLMGSFVYRACERANIPYVVHFHGADAHVTTLVESLRQDYFGFFRSASAVIGVSMKMVEQLASLGAPADRLIHAPYGVALPQRQARPADAPPQFLSVGRLVEKKAPIKTLQAFAQVYEQCPEARLLIVGDGPLLPQAKRTVEKLGLEEAVQFLGVRSRAEVSQLMRNSRAFVQHSIMARDGDSEGLPLAILEAGAHGLPVVSTRHAGIPDAIVEQEHGYLVDEGDVKGMGASMLKLAQDPLLAARMGKNYREQIEAKYSRRISTERLQRILKTASEEGGLYLQKAKNPLTESELESRLPTLRKAPDCLNLANEASRSKLPKMEEAFLFQALGFDRNCAEAYLRIANLQLPHPEKRTDAWLCLREAARCADLTTKLKELTHTIGRDPAVKKDPLRDVYLTYTGATPIPKSSSPRRILIFTNLLPPQEMGGYGRTIWEFADLLIKRGHAVEILTADMPHLTRESQSAENPVEPNTSRTLKLYGDWRDGRAISESDDSKIMEIAQYNQKVVAEATDRFKPDAVIAGNIDFMSPLPIYEVLKRGLPVLHRLGNAYPGFKPEETPKSPSYCIASCSDWVNTGLRKDGYKPGSFEVLYPGSPLERYYRMITPIFDRLRICFAGLLQPYKGAQVLMKALLLLKRMHVPFRCEFAGDSTDPRFVEELKQIARDGNFAADVRFPGFLSKEGLAALYARSNVMVFPSVFEEPFGKSQIEAMAAGIAVVTSGTGGSQEIVQDNHNGVVFKSNDPEDLARQLYILQANPELWAKLAAQGQADAFKFTTLNSVLKIEEIFERLLS